MAELVDLPLRETRPSERVGDRVMALSHSRSDSEALCLLRREPAGTVVKANQVRRFKNLGVLHQLEATPVSRLSHACLNFARGRKCDPRP